ncbi:MAG: LamG-like jellyroll fold domain-containing protein [Flavobacterium sp.]
MKKKLLLLTMGFAMATQMITAQVPDYVPANGLAGWWSFNNNANDASLNANNGTVTGATLVADRFGNPNSAYSFNGVNQWIEIANSNSLNPTSQLSISVWVESTAQMGNAGIVGKWNNFGGNIGNGREQYTITTGNTGVGFYIQTNSSVLAQETNSLYNNGSWHNYIGVWDGSTMKLFRDGVLVSTVAQTGSISSLVQGLEIGRYAGGQGTGVNNNYFKGKIDDIGIWNRALTVDEINNLYNANICYQNITVTDTLVINIGILSYNPVTYNSTVTIYPNPANDHITIDCGNLANITGYQIKIFNELGQAVFTGAMNTQQYNVPLNTWSGKGLYLVKVYDASNNEVNVKKIILQ